MLKVTFFNRDKRDAVFSIEEVFSIIQKELNGKVLINNYYYDPAIGRIRSVFKAKKYQGDINHITGDVHFLALGLSSSRTIITIHDMGHFEEGLKGFIQRRIYKLFWFDLPFRKIKYITTVSSFTKERIMHYFSIESDKIKVIHNPAPSDFSFSIKEFNTTEPVILQIGSSFNKNIERLIEAVSGMPVKLVLVRRYDEQIQQLLIKNNIKHEWKNNLTREELYRTYCDSDIIYFASTYEGFGVPILEANAIGRVVIAGNVASMPEVAGDAACIVNPFSIDEIKNAIIRIRDDEFYRNDLIGKGRTNVKRFKKEDIAEQYYELYKSINKT